WDFALLAATAISIAGHCRRYPRLVVLRLERAWQQRKGSITEIRRIKIVLAGNANQREQGITASGGQRRAHTLGIGGPTGRTDRPIRGNPFAGGVGKRGGQIDHAGGLIDRGRL